MRMLRRFSSSRPFSLQQQALVFVVLCSSALVACSPQTVGKSAAPQTSSTPGVLAGVQQATCATQQTDVGAPGPYPVGALTQRFTRSSSTSGALRMLDTVIWYPAAASTWKMPLDDAVRAVEDAPALAGCLAPVIFFSHGSDSSPLAYTFLATHLASMGFVVIAPHHPDAEESDASAAINRPADISFLIDQLPMLNTAVGLPLHGLLNMSLIGIAGHSFGGYTAVYVAAHDSRISAALPMAPGGADILPSAPAISIPLLIMAGDNDHIVPYTNSQQLYSALSPSMPHGLLTLHGSDHLVFGDTCGATNGCRSGDPENMPIHEVINRYATAFFLAYLAADHSAGALLNPADSTTPATTLETEDMP